MKKALLSLLIITFLTTSLFASSTELHTNKSQCPKNPKRIDAQSSIDWYRISAEKKILYRQIYMQASEYIKNWVTTNHPKKNTWGVIIDIDETALDNSWYYNKCLDMADDEDDFSHYIDIPAKSVALPGSVKFTQLVHKLGGYVSLVSNRDGSFEDSTGNVLKATIKNLSSQNIYFDQVVLANRKQAKNPTNKNPRFKAIQTGIYNQKLMTYSNKLPAHQIVAYLGDNIKDFPNLNQQIIKKDTSASYNKFGKGYFMFPNPMYGSWENK